MKQNELLFGSCIVIFMLWGEYLLFLYKTEPWTERSCMTCPTQPMGHFSQWCGDRRCCCVYEMYNISEKNSAVALLTNTTPSVKQEVSSHLNKNPLSLKQTKGFIPFPSWLLSQYWLKFNHYLTIADFEGHTKKVLDWETATDPEVEKQRNKIVDFQQLKKSFLIKPSYSKWWLAKILQT